MVRQAVQTMGVGARVCGLLLLMTILTFSAQAADSWGELQRRFRTDSVQRTTSFPVARSASRSPGENPWTQLQAVYLPFSQAEEETALINPRVKQKVATKLHATLAPYQNSILEASQRFDVPVAVIAAVIMVESSGNPNAAAGTSSAKGLMQTIDATFAEACSSLKVNGLMIKYDPFDPRASIMAGTWYLDRMFRKVQQDRNIHLNRANISAWRLPTEYYYAGPGHGRKRSPVVMIYSGGQQVRVDKAGYSSKVLRWARIMA